jgi:2'-5' RNA ligase
VSDALAPVRAAHPHVRWLARDKLHLTLVFLGATDAARVPQLSQAVAAAAARHARFDVVTGEAGGRISEQRGVV